MVIGGMCGVPGASASAAGRLCQTSPGEHLAAGFGSLGPHSAYKRSDSVASGPSLEPFPLVGTCHLPLLSTPCESSWSGYWNGTGSSGRLLPGALYCIGEMSEANCGLGR